MAADGTPPYMHRMGGGGVVWHGAVMVCWMMGRLCVLLVVAVWVVWTLEECRDDDGRTDGTRRRMSPHPYHGTSLWVIGWRRV